MEAPFKKLGLAITFSPTGKALLKEAKRLQDLFKSEIYFIHIGERSIEKEKLLTDLIIASGFSPDNFNLLWGSGDIATTIIGVCLEKKIDLLIAGALEKESFLKYYIGSVARKLMRESPCSLLVFTEPSETPKSFNKFCTSIDYSPMGEKTIITAYEFAILENANELTVIREFQVPGLATTVYDAGSTKEAEEVRQRWEAEEKEKMSLFIKELNLTGIKINIVSLYGKEGWESNRYVEEMESDIFIVPSPQKKLNLFDRIFQHDIEFSIKNVPCPLLIVKRNPS